LEYEIRPGRRGREAGCPPVLAISHDVRILKEC